MHRLGAVPSRCLHQGRHDVVKEGEESPWTFLQASRESRPSSPAPSQCESLVWPRSREEFFLVGGPDQAASFFSYEWRFLQPDFARGALPILEVSCRRQTLSRCMAGGRGCRSPMWQDIWISNVVTQLLTHAAMYACAVVFVPEPIPALVWAKTGARPGLALHTCG